MGKKIALLLQYPTNLVQICLASCAGIFVFQLLPVCMEVSDQLNTAHLVIKITVTDMF
jgi:hypothetical protein